MSSENFIWTFILYVNGWQQNYKIWWYWLRNLTIMFTFINSYNCVTVGGQTNLYNVLVVLKGKSPWSVTDDWKKKKQYDQPTRHKRFPGKTILWINKMNINLHCI